MAIGLSYRPKRSAATLSFSARLSAFAAYPVLAVISSSWSWGLFTGIVLPKEIIEVELPLPICMDAKQYVVCLQKLGGQSEDYRGGAWKPSRELLSSFNTTINDERGNLTLSP
jgi:hypothetical protein